ncbi:hypothetical protein [Roseateles sp.]|uniref:hypothetical protein n=1 Tax=Roseateles sp. TaxID=1971397 RepID=UPI003267263E
MILSIDEWETMMSGVACGAIELVSFLRKVAADNADPSTSVMLVEQMLSRQAENWPLPPLIASAQTQTEAMLMEMLEAAEKATG